MFTPCVSLTARILTLFIAHFPCNLPLFLFLSDFLSSSLPKYFNIFPKSHWAHVAPPGEGVGDLSIPLAFRGISFNFSSGSNYILTNLEAELAGVC